jgi:hypothetical protein
MFYLPLYQTESRQTGQDKPATWTKKKTDAFGEEIEENQVGLHNIDC